MNDNIDIRVLAILEATPAVLRAIVEGAPAAALDEPLDEGWAVRDAIAHVLDCEDGVIVARLRRITGEDRPFIRSIDATARLRDGGYASRSVTDLLDALAEARARNLAWARTLDAAALARAGDHDEAGEITASDIAHQWAYHDLMHIKQVLSMLQSPLVKRMGNTRKFYDV
jgi:hypothetical protein